LKLQEIDSEFSQQKKEISLSSRTLAELLQNTLAKGASLRFSVTGFSMFPFIKNGDIVIISPLSLHSIGIGKPVAFINPNTGKFAIHRIVGKKGGYYLVKGDNISEADGLVSMENILGVVTKVERKNRELFLGGLGLERFIIAFLSRRNNLFLLFRIRRLIPFTVRKFVKWIILS
jgi:signal peptidase I